MIVTSVLLIFVLILFAAFFASSETAYATVNKLRLSRLCEETESPALKLAERIADDFQTLLSSVLIGNNLVSIGASSIATTLFTLLIADETAAGFVATGVMTLLLLTFGEITPKIIAKRHSMTLVRAYAYPMRCMMWILRPLSFVFMLPVRILSKLWTKKEDAALTGEELSSIIEAVEEDGVIDEEKSDLLRSAIDFADTTVEELITPRKNVLFIDVESSMDEIIETALSSRYSRLPVYEETRDNVLGILYLNNFFKAVLEQGKENVDLRALLLPPCYAHKTMRLPDALAELQERKTHLMIVLDEYGGTMGIVTMEDILEEIVGDIWDESDEITSEFIKTAENRYDVSGSANVYDFFTFIGKDDRDFESEYNTVGGWAVEMLESDPHVGDSFIYENLYLIVKEMEDNCVTKLSVIVTPETEEE